MKQNIKETVIELIEKKCEKKIDADKFIHELNMDSIEFIELIVDIEKNFCIEFDDDVLIRTAFSKVADIIEYVNNKVICMAENDL